MGFWWISIEAILRFRVVQAHKLKNDGSKTYQAAAQIRTKLRYGLTGTVMQVGCKFLTASIASVAKAHIC